MLQLYLDKGRATSDGRWVKKTFPFTNPRHEPERVVESIKSEVRKYLKRERRKELPEGQDFWDFDCRAGVEESAAQLVHVKEINAAIDKAFAANREGGVYIEVLRKSRKRQKKGGDS